MPVILLFIQAIQAADPAGPWVTWLIQPAIVLGGTGLFVRLLLWPALKNLMRAELKSELDMIDEHREQIRDVRAQGAANAEAIASLRDVPVMLARIEANVQELMERRHTARDVAAERRVPL